MARESDPQDDLGKNSGALAPAAAAGLPDGNTYRLTGRYPIDQQDTADLGQAVRNYLRIFNKRKWLILSISLGVLCVGTVWTLLQTPLYTSTVRLQIDRNVSKIVEGGNITPAEGEDGEFLRTQYELLQSRSLAERVASSARLADDPDFFKPRVFSIPGAVKSFFSLPRADPVPDRAKLLEVAGGIVQRSVAVRPVSGSRLLDVSYVDTNPERSQKIASAYADAFIASNLDKRFEANAYAKTFLEDQIKQLKLRLEQSETAMLAFAEKEQIVSVGEKSSIAESNLAGANVVLGNLASERIKNEQLWRQVDQTKDTNLPQFLTNAVIDGLRAKRNELATEYQEKLETFKPGYPQMVQIKNKIGEIDRQLASEFKTIRNSLKGAYESSLSQENEVKARIEKLQAEVLDYQKRSIQYNILKREADTNRELYNGLLQRFKEVDVAGGVGSNNVFIVDKANLPGAPSSPQLLRAVLLSFMLGLGGALGLAYLLENLDDVIDTIEDAERVGGLAMLGVIPLVRSKTGAESELQDIRSPLSEAYRSLCTALQFTTAQGMPRSLLITSAGPGEGKSLTSIAISQHFARLGLKVLLIDGDLRNPSLHHKLSADNSVGLSSYLTGACNPPEAMQKTTDPNLAFMPSGPLPPNAADLLHGAKLHSLISLGLEVFDLIIIDAPPVLGIADAPILSSATEATAFVIGAGVARTGSVRSALKRLELSKSPIIGTIVTKFDAKRAGHGYGYGLGDVHYTYGYGNASLEHKAVRGLSLQSEA